MMSHLSQFSMAERPRGGRNNSHTCEPGPQQYKSQKGQTAANRFFRNPDLCTLLTETLIANIRPAKICTSDSGTSSLLVLRAITREAWRAVMTERPSRIALSLAARDQVTEGVLIPFDLDEATEEESSHLFAEREPQACIITHHRAIVHSDGYASIPYLFIPIENFESCAGLPLARDMFLTQPPRKTVRFGIRYEYNPGSRVYFEIHEERGVRFGDLVERLERQPELMKRPVLPGHGLYPYRRWLRDSNFIGINRIDWEYQGPAAVRRHPYRD